ncbi:Tat pathway signal sequence domain protein [Streptomyces sp. NPDC090106]|uniref:Tat pathway signal sequence domain protein n=1 Tax=Streptomyces sp. NPDC090106 TaxID=3365946 RepID=UPI0038012017
MRETVHRHLGKVMAGAGIAVAATAVMVGITLPGTAGADENGAATADGRAVAGAGRQGQGEGQGQAGAAAPGVVEQAPAEGEKGTGRDPLTDDERERVAELALNRQLFNAGENVEGDRGPQRLDIQLGAPEADELDAADAPRRADVTYYDYKDDTLVTRTVNLDTGKVEATTTNHGVQPPLSEAEETEAARLLLASPLAAGLKGDYRDATDQALTSPGQLQLNSMIFKADPGIRPAALAVCGEHRCATLSPKVRNGPWIDTRDLVIDLSARKVVAIDRG